MRILLTGASGQVGQALLPHLRQLCAPADLLAPSRQRLDLSQPDQLAPLIRQFRPHWIINAAAYTAVDQAETEPHLAQAINAAAPGRLGELSREVGALLVHYSTDYVFDGSGERPWEETDERAPLNQYGRSKRDGEDALMASGDRWLLLRTSWVYARTGRNFLTTIERLARQQPQLSVIADQIGAPTWAEHIAQATLAALKKPTPLQGIYHLCNGGETSWAGFAQAILRQQQIDCVIKPIPAADYPLEAPRPLNSRLNTRRLHAEGIALPHWQEALTQALL